MLTELIILSPIVLFLWWLNISLYWSLLVLFILYWLPKRLIGLIASFYPNVVFWGPNKTKKTMIALTFDDAPFAKTQKIINLLNEFDAKATFFIISDPTTWVQYFINGYNSVKEPAYKLDIEGCKEILKKAVVDGHQLGNHGKTNSIHLLKHCQNKLISSEIKPCDEFIRSIYTSAGIPTPEYMVYRPGCGLFTSDMVQKVKDEGYTTVLGSIYPNDPVVPFATLNYWYIKLHLEWNNSERADIIILHDRVWTVNMLRKLLVYLKQNDYVCVTLDTLLSSK